MPTDSPPAYTVPSARIAARIILFLSQFSAGRRLSEIAQELQLNVSTCHNVLRTLTDIGVLALDPDTKSYRLGLNLINAVSTVIARGDPLSLIKPILQRLGERTRMTAILGEISSPDQIRILVSAIPTGSITLNAPGGTLFPLLSGAMGRVVASQGGFAREELRARFDATPREKVVRFEDYLSEIADVPAKGWAMDEGTFQRGIWGIATAVPSATRGLDKLLCLACAAETLPEPRVLAVASDLMATASEIGVGLGHKAG